MSDMTDLNAEILEAWGSARFGPKGDTPEGRLSLILEALGKYAKGYATGFTLQCICDDLGLIRNERGSRHPKLSVRGLHWLIAYSRRPDIETRDAEIADLQRQLAEAMDALREASKLLRGHQWDSKHGYGLIIKTPDRKEWFDKATNWPGHALLEKHND